MVGGTQAESSGMEKAAPSTEMAPFAESTPPEPLPHLAMSVQCNLDEMSTSVVTPVRNVEFLNCV